MNFLISIDLNDLTSIFTKLGEGEKSEHFKFWHWEKADIIKSKEENTLVWMGDLIKEEISTRKVYLEKLANNFSYKELIKAGGFFYGLYYKKQDKQLKVFSSFGGILPIYYSKEGKQVFIASDIKHLHNQLNKQKIVSKKYIVERLLFNYPLTSNTLFTNIKRLPANTALVIDNSVNEERYFEMESLFSDHPDSSTKTYDALAELFIEQSKRYFPGETIPNLSFTSGFDSRTLLSIARHYKIPVKTYAFGSRDSSDIRLPKEQSLSLSVPFVPFLLDDYNYLEKSFELGQEFIMGSSGEANLARAHYAYAAKNLAKDSRYIISGNFGSELFRAFHNTGVMCSKWLYLLFSGKDRLKIRKALLQASELDLIYNNEKDQIIDDLLEDYSQQNWLWKGKMRKTNSKFYLFVLEEMFRKYFGSEIHMQMKYLYNRAPFFDSHFITELFKTNLAGVYSNFFENRPLKRFKGQLFYAYVIKKADNSLYRMKTGKGYCPADLLSFRGKISIAGQKCWSVIQPDVTVADPYAVLKAFYTNKEQYRKMVEGSQLFIPERIINLLHQQPSNYVFTAISLNSYYSVFNK